MLPAPCEGDATGLTAATALVAASVGAMCAAASPKLMANAGE